MVDEAQRYSDFAVVKECYGDDLERLTIKGWRLIEVVHTGPKPQAYLVGILKGSPLHQTMTNSVPKQNPTIAKAKRT